MDDTARVDLQAVAAFQRPIFPVVVNIAHLSVNLITKDAELPDI
jgi:hypothetical protein